MQQQQQKLLQGRALPTASQINISKIDSECQNLITLLTKKTPLQIESNIYYFLQENLNLCSRLITNLDFKTSYFVYKKIEKLLIQILQGLISENNNESYPILKLVQILVNEEQFPNQEILLSEVEQLVPDRNKIKHKQMNYAIFLEKISRFITIIQNNIATFYALRGKSQQALIYLLKIFSFRKALISSQISLFQLAGIASNISYCLSLINDEQTPYDAALFAGAAALLFQSPGFQQSGNQGLIVEKSTDFIIILDLITNKTATQYNEKFVSVQEKIYSLLESIFYFQYEIFTKQGRTDEAKKAEENAENIISLLTDFQSNQMANQQQQQKQQQIMQQNVPQFNQQQKNQLQKQQQEMIKQRPQQIQLNQQQKNQFQRQQQQNQQIQQNEEVQIDSLSQASMQSVDTNSVFSQTQSQLLQKDNIIFQKYMQKKQKTFNFFNSEINQMKYKIIFVQIPEYNCIQILLYCKPRQFLKKIVIGFQSIIDYANQSDQMALQNEQSLNTLLKQIAKKLFVRNNELFIKEIEFYRTIDDFLKFNKNIQPSANI